MICVFYGGVLMTFNFFRRAVSAVTAALCLTAAVPAVPLTANA